MLAGKTLPNVDHTLEITIQFARGSRLFSFPKTTKAAEVTSAAVTALGFAPTDRYELVLSTDPGHLLAPERLPVSYHITDGAVFTLTAIGIGTLFLHDRSS